CSGGYDGGMVVVAMAVQYWLLAVTVVLDRISDRTKEDQAEINQSYDGIVLSLAIPHADLNYLLLFVSQARTKEDQAGNQSDSMRSYKPVHLTVDTRFTNGEASIKAFVSVNLSLGDQQLAAQFQEIPLDLRMVEAERVGCMCLHVLDVCVYTYFSIHSFYHEW
ncbi:eukaryotic translation initiation factor 3 subunit F, partial [Tanacetum coccineum]